MYQEGFYYISNWDKKIKQKGTRSKWPKWEVDANIYELAKTAESEFTEIKDFETAVSYGNAIFQNIKNEEYFNKLWYSEPPIRSVFYDAKSEIWIIHFFEYDVADGSILQIAFQAKDAKILKIWLAQ